MIKIISGVSNVSNNLQIIKGFVCGLGHWSYSSLFGRFNQINAFNGVL